MNKIIQSFILLPVYLGLCQGLCIIKVNFLCLFSYFCFVTEKRFQIMDLYIGQNHFQRPNTANFEVFC